MRTLCNIHPDIDYMHHWGCPECLKDLRKHQSALIELIREADRIEKEGLNCSYCPNIGWYADRDKYTGEPVQVQCEFCHTEPNSKFNLRQQWRVKCEANGIKL